MGEESLICLFWNSSSGNSDKLLPTVKITERKKKKKKKKINQIPKAKLDHKEDLNKYLKNNRMNKWIKT